MKFTRSAKFALAAAASAALAVSLLTPAQAATVDYRREHMTMSRVWAASRRTLTTRTHRTTEPPSFARPMLPSLSSDWTVGLRSMVPMRQLLSQRWLHTCSPLDLCPSVSTLVNGVTTRAALSLYAVLTLITQCKQSVLMLHHQEDTGRYATSGVPLGASPASSS